MIKILPHWQIEKIVEDREWYYIESGDKTPEPKKQRKRKTMTDKCDNCGKQVADNEQKSASALDIGDKHFSIQIYYTKWDSSGSEESEWLNTKKRESWLCHDCFRTILSAIPVPAEGE
jgi:hypothetical protein